MFKHIEGVSSERKCKTVEICQKNLRYAQGLSHMNMLSGRYLDPLGLKSSVIEDGEYSQLQPEVDMQSMEFTGLSTAVDESTIAADQESFEFFSRLDQYPGGRKNFTDKILAHGPQHKPTITADAEVNVGLRL